MVLHRDFNDVLAQLENRGGQKHSDHLIHGFQEAMNYGGLRKVEMSGYQFTWERSSGTSNCIEEKLDKVLASDAWNSVFPEASVINEDAPPSDHSALILSFGHRVVHRKSRFCFENAWICGKECRVLISQSWNQTITRDLQGIIEKCGVSLEAWGCDRRKKFRNQLTRCRKRIRDLKHREAANGDSQVKEAREELVRLLTQ